MRVVSRDDEVSGASLVEVLHAVIWVLPDTIFPTARLAAPEVADIGLRPREERSLRGKMTDTSKTRILVVTVAQNSMPWIIASTAYM